jgi:predicted AlkP superfamily pyrophosphatase or phosphodiesterase
VHLAEIAPSIFAGLGLSDAQDLLGLGPSPHGRECLFLIDGLGEQALIEYAPYAPTLSGLVSRGPVTTAFPSTTVTSLTTLMTGELPGAHGMLGYTIRVPRSGGRILNSLKWDERVDPYTWQPIPTLFERAKLQGIQVSHVAAKRYEGTGFTSAAFRGAQYRGANVLEEMAEQASASLKDSLSFTYVYVNEVDVAGHSDGVGSDKWLGALSYVDRVTATLIEQLPRGTRIWITADHGMVNAKEKILKELLWWQESQEPDIYISTMTICLAKDQTIQPFAFESFFPDALTCTRARRQSQRVCLASTSQRHRKIGWVISSSCHMSRLF